MQRDFGCSPYDAGYRSLGVQVEEEQYGQCPDGGQVLWQTAGKELPWEGRVDGRWRGYRPLSSISIPCLLSPRSVGSNAPAPFLLFSFPRCEANLDFVGSYGRRGGYTVRT